MLASHIFPDLHKHIDLIQITIDDPQQRWGHGVIRIQIIVAVSSKGSLVDRVLKLFIAWSVNSVRVVTLTTESEMYPVVRHV